MMRAFVLVILVLAACCRCTAGGQAGTQPATSAAPAVTTSTVPASQPSATTATAPAVDAEVYGILKQQEEAGRKYATIRADLTVEVVDRRVGDSEERTGWVVYQRADQQNASRFRIHFDTLKQGRGAKLKQELDWAFDGHWLAKADPGIRQIQRFQVVPEGEKAEPMKLGKGPLPLPFGQDADEVLKYYEVTTRGPVESDPKGTRYLAMTARKEHYRDLDTVHLEVWMDSQTHLPARIVGRDKKNKVTTGEFRKVETDVSIDQKRMFELPKPLGWTEEKRPLEE